MNHCLTCIHFHAHRNQVADHYATPTGDCRRYPPVLVCGSLLGKWPAVSGSSTCGEHRPSEAPTAVVGDPGAAVAGPIGRWTASHLRLMEIMSDWRMKATTVKVRSRLLKADFWKAIGELKAAGYVVAMIDNGREYLTRDRWGEFMAECRAVVGGST